MKKQLLLLATCVCMAAGIIHAEDLYVHTSKGSIQLGDINDVSEITFGETATTVTLVDGNASSFDYNDFIGFSFSPNTPTTVLNTITADNFVFNGRRASFPYADNMAIKVYSMAGSLVAETFGNEIDLSNLAAGAYILKTDGGTFNNSSLIF